MSVHVHAKRAACLLAAPCVVRLLMRHGTGVVPLRSSTAGTDLVPVFADHSILYSTAVLGRYTTLIRREGSARLNAASRSIPARAAVCTVRAIYVIAHSRVAKDPKGSGISRGMTRKLAGRPASMGHICTVCIRTVYFPLTLRRPSQFVAGGRGGSLRAAPATRGGLRRARRREAVEGYALRSGSRDTGARRIVRSWSAWK